MRYVPRIAACIAALTLFATVAEAAPRAKSRTKRARTVAAAAPQPPEIDPYRVHLRYRALCDAIQRAKTLLIKEEVGTDVVGGRHGVLAIWQPDRNPEDIRIVHVRDGTSQTLGFEVQAFPWNGLAPTPGVDTYNGVNTYYKVTSPQNWVTLAFKTNTRKTPGAIYVPYNPAYQTSEVVANGRQYLLDLIASAKAHLNANDVKSGAFPKKLVTEVIDADVLLTLLIIEHTDRDETRVRGTEWTAEKMLTTVALNREGVYAHAVSSAGAGGLAQFMPGTYRGTRARYPDAKLLESFEDGMRDHVNAVVAQYCLADYSYSELVEERVRKPRTMELLGAYLAAAYNGGEGKAVPAYKRHARHCIPKRSRYGREWCAHSHGLYDETVNYLKKFAGTYRYVVRTKE